MNLLKHLGFKIYKLSAYLATFTLAFIIYALFKICIMFH
jgi:hypothetical protein